MGIFKHLKNTGKNLVDAGKDLGGKVVDEGKELGDMGKDVAKFALTNPYVSPAVSAAMSQAGIFGYVAFDASNRLAERDFTRPADVVGKEIMVMTHQGQLAAKVLAIAGPMVVVAGEMTAQPEIVAMGKSMEKASDMLYLATAGGENLAVAVDAGIHGDKKEFMHALGRAVSDYGNAIYQYMMPEQLDEVIVELNMIAEGDPRGFEALGQSLAIEYMRHNTVAASMGSNEAIDSLQRMGYIEPSVTDEEREKYGAWKIIDMGTAAVFGADDYKSALEVENGTEGTTPGTMESDNLAPSEMPTVTSSEDPEETPLDMGEDAEPTVPPPPATETPTVTLPEPEVQNYDKDVLYAQKGAGKTDEGELPSIKYHVETAPIAQRGVKRGYRALKELPVQYGNAGFSVSMHGPRVATPHRKKVLTDNKMKLELQGRATVRGFTANFTSKPRRADTGRDARGAKVQYVDAIKGGKGRLQADETQQAVERSVDPWRTKVLDDVQVQAKGPDKGHTRSRAVGRRSNPTLKRVAATPSRTKFLFNK